MPNQDGKLMGLPFGKAMKHFNEGLSMSEDEEQLSSEDHDLTRILNDLDIDHKLLSAAQRGQSELVKDLLNSGAQVITDENGTTALHISSQNGFPEVVRLLLEHGTDVDLPDSSGCTALHKAASRGHLDVLELLLTDGCDIDTQDDVYGNIPLHEAAWNGYSKSVDLLLKNKSNAFITNRAGCTALHFAAQNGHNQCGRTLLYAGCSPDVKNNFGDTPLHTASRYGHAGIARILISARCSVSEQNKNGDTALHIAAAFKRPKIARLLVEAGVQLGLTNKQGETAVDIARKKEHVQIVQFLLEVEKPPSAAKFPNTDAGTSSNDRETPESKETKKKTSFASWIKKRFGKEKISLENDQTQFKEHRSQGHRHKALKREDRAGNEGLFSQYIKSQGFAYYRDLAGNIRQGPCGYVPACHCESRMQFLEDQLAKTSRCGKDRAEITHHQFGKRLKELEHNTTKKVSAVEQAAREMLEEEKGECLDRLARHTEQERKVMHKQLAQVESHVRNGLQSWLETQITEGRAAENPFAYAVGAKQMRFGDDFDRDRIIKCEEFEQYPPPPRLFRSRSDETISHSEYSYHGRAYKSREAAIEELKTLKHHEEIRERRRQIRALGAVEFRTGSNDDLLLHHQTRPLTKKSPSQPSGLWMSRDGLNRDDQTYCHGAEDSVDNKKQMRVDQSQIGDNCQITSAVKSQNQAISTPNTERPPLKSALRQPRLSDSDNKRSVCEGMARSTSVGRLDEQETIQIKPPFHKADTRIPKAVRYNDTIVSADNGSPIPSSIREAPIGGLDSNSHYTEQNASSDKPPPYMASHKQFINQESSKDIRDSIVNTRNELLARSSKPGTETVAQVQKPSVKFSKDVDTSYCDQYDYSCGENSRYKTLERSSEETRASRVQPAGDYQRVDAIISQAHVPPVGNDISHLTLRSYVTRNTANTTFATELPASVNQLPFANYKLSPNSAPNGNIMHTHTLPQSHESMSRQTGDYMLYEQIYAPNRYPQNPTLNGTTTNRSLQETAGTQGARRPLPTYEEIQRLRGGLKHPQETVISRQTHNCQQTSRSKPYYGNTQHSQSNFGDSLDSRKPNGFVQSPSLTVMNNRQKNVRVNAVQGNAMLSPSSVVTEDRAPVNAGSCSSSNPDSGYGGHNFDIYASHSVVSPTGYNTSNCQLDYDVWYEQRLQVASRKLNNFSSPAGRIGRTNMISDV